MSGASDVVAFYTSHLPPDIVEETIATCERVGFEIDVENGGSDAADDRRSQELRIRYDEGWFNAFVYTDEGRPPTEPVVGISFAQRLKPTRATDERAFRDRMHAVFELVCRLAVTLDADYAPLFCPPNRRADLDGRPVVENLADLPRIGVYDRAVVDQYGSLEAMFDSTPWYSAALERDKTVVVETERPWGRVDWRPPIRADFLENAAFANPDERE